VAAEAPPFEAPPFEAPPFEAPPFEAPPFEAPPPPLAGPPALAPPDPPCAGMGLPVFASLLHAEAKPTTEITPSNHFD